MWILSDSFANTHAHRALRCSVHACALGKRVALCINLYFSCSKWKRNNIHICTYYRLSPHWDSVYLVLVTRPSLATTLGAHLYYAVFQLMLKCYFCTFFQRIDKHFCEAFICLQPFCVLFGFYFDSFLIAFVLFWFCFGFVFGCVLTLLTDALFSHRRFLFDFWCVSKFEFVNAALCFRV